ncbi:MAG TPA: hypothetical protein VEE84_08080, partial [Burkholderiaceae bacterium]|nr:hypothetical protein [Burkholderiaceae bacterium]
MKRRALLLGAALAGSVAWSGWVLLAPQDEVVQATIRSTNAKPQAAPTARTRAGDNPRTGPAGATPGRFELTQRPQAPFHSRNLFAAYTYEPARQPQRAEAPEPPRAPPLPFTYAGRLIVDGRPTYLLLQAGAPIGVTVGADVGDFKLVDVA